MKTYIKILFLVTIILTAVSCKKNKEIEPDDSTEAPASPSLNLTKIGETYIVGANAKAIIYSNKQFETGYNEVYVSFVDSTDGSSLNIGKVTLTPMMNMGSMTHSSPVENTTDSIATNGYFKSAVVFTMPGTASEWSLNISFKNFKNGITGIGNLAFSVSSTTPAKFKSTVLSLDNNRKVYISLIQPTSPQVGKNDFEIVIHEKVSSMNYPSIDDYTVEIEPEMPSMGHGSPNNVNPVFVSKGHYLGRVNFTMTGLWYVHIKLYKNGNLISNDQYFEMTLQ